MQKRELGPYAYEKQMPRWLMKQLEKGPKVQKYKTRGRDGRIHIEEFVENETTSIVPMLARLSELDSLVTVAYYSHPATKHICKIRGESGFCGYHNTMMQFSYLQGAKAQGYEVFPGPRIPGILWLQDRIEEAWDKGISPISRQQVGQLKGTRKWIGTTESNALFTNLGIACDVYAYFDNTNEGTLAYETMFNRIEQYFKAGGTPNDQATRSSRSLYNCGWL